MSNTNIIPISQARFKVTIVKTMMATNDYSWKAETEDNIGTSFSLYDNNHAIGSVYEISDTPEKAYERFERFAKLNGITNYEVDLTVRVMLNK